MAKLNLSLIQVSRTKRVLEVPVGLVSVDDKMTLQLACQNYGHVLQSTTSEAERFTYEEFADRIEQVYDVTTPQAACLVQTLRKVHQTLVCFNNKEVA